MSRFSVAPSSEWVLADSLQSQRRDWLLRVTSFERVIAALVTTCSRLSFHRERAKSHAGARCIVTIEVSPEQLDRFFNSSCGYRAQYLASPREAHLADQCVVESVLPLAIAALASRPQRLVDRPFVEASLCHPWAKVWPHQGLWLRRAKLVDRILLVPQWQQQLRTTRSSHQRQLAVWGSLAPARESHLQVKGGFVHAGKHLRLGKPQSERAQEIHKLGFT